ncbi:MAG: hypothetical protein NTY84_14490 [Verrucomicrobia bacterium]|nr:hypothetical protein [Verrucomicrobiota bacterium]
MFGTFVIEAQTRNRSLVAWGENLLGLNRPPELPAGIVASDVKAVTAGELVSGLTLRPGILVGGAVGRCVGLDGCERFIPGSGPGIARSVGYRWGQQV